MIASLHGVVQSKDERSLIVLVNGIGYLVKVSGSVISEVQNGEEVRLLTYLQVTENDLALYGFLEAEELAFFKQLITVSGIGPKTALGILDSPLEVVKQAIFAEDAATLSKLPGIGKKTAERIIVELKSKVSLPSGDKLAVSGKLQSEALEALLSLGYARYEAIQMLQKVPSDVQEVEEQVRIALSSK